MALVLIITATLNVLPTVSAQNHADDSYHAFVSAFLVKKEGKTYFCRTLAGPKRQEPAYFWTQALDISLVMDVYERTRDPELVKLIRALLTTLVGNKGVPDWSWDIWNDDIGLVTAVCARGYLITGDKAFRDAAEVNWNMAYKRAGGWDNVIGGGFYETIDVPKAGVEDYIDRKSALANNYMAMAACYLHEGTGKIVYLEKAERIYAWVRNNLFVATQAQVGPGQALGQVNENRWARAVDWKGNPHTIGELDPSDHVHNSGQFLVCAMQLARLTRKESYVSDAVLAADHVVNTHAILSYTGQDESNQWAYFFTKGLSDLCNYTDRWPTYYPWLLTNAKTAWAQRDRATNLTWNEWNKPTQITDPNETYTIPFTSAVAIWQHLAIPARFMMINRASSQALDLIGDDFSNGAALHQSPMDRKNTDLHLAFLPTENGDHFKIVSTRSGKAVQIQSNSKTKGARLVSSTYALGNSGQQFDLIATENVWFKIKNVRSGKVLEVANSPADKPAKVQQNTDAKTPNQEWRLEPVGDYYLRAAHTGRYLSVENQGANKADHIVQSDWDTTPRFQWRFTPRDDGWFGLHSLNAPAKIDSGAGEQTIRIVPQTNGKYKFYSKQGGLAWRIADGQIKSNTVLIQAADTSDNGQDFLLERVP